MSDIEKWFNVSSYSIKYLDYIIIPSVDFVETDTGDDKPVLEYDIYKDGQYVSTRESVESAKDLIIAFKTDSFED